MYVAVRVHRDLPRGPEPHSGAAGLLHSLPITLTTAQCCLCCASDKPAHSHACVLLPLLFRGLMNFGRSPVFTLVKEALRVSPWVNSSSKRLLEEDESLYNRSVLDLYIYFLT